jgi:hypothetical protein
VLAAIFELIKAGYRVKTNDIYRTNIVARYPILSIFMAHRHESETHMEDENRYPWKDFQVNYLPASKKIRESLGNERLCYVVVISINVMVPLYPSSRALA